MADDTFNVCGRSTLTVTHDDTALSMGSGSLPVLSTPALVALMENAATQAVANCIPEGATTVGSYIEVEHRAPSAIGETVTATARIVSQEGSRFTFEIEATGANGVIAKARHKRVAVVSDRFLEKIMHR